jgi:hypothetical protein
MDKLFKLFKGEKKNTESSKPIQLIKDSTEGISNTEKVSTEQVIEHPKNEILFLNSTTVDNIKKHEGFYYKKYINEITKLKLVLFYKPVKSYNSRKRKDENKFR